MWKERDDQERPCLHCMMIEMLDEYYAEYPATTGEPDAIDTDAVVTAIAKTVAELTCGQNGTIRQQLIEQLTREIMNARLSPLRAFSRSRRTSASCVETLLPLPLSFRVTGISRDRLMSAAKLRTPLSRPRGLPDGPFWKRE